MEPAPGLGKPLVSFHSRPKGILGSGEEGEFGVQSFVSRLPALIGVLIGALTTYAATSAAEARVVATRPGGPLGLPKAHRIR